TAEARSTIELFDGSDSLGTVTADDSGNWTFTSGSLADGSHSITATTKDSAGNTSAASTAIVIQIDTAAPSAPSSPDLDAASDTGKSSTDNITSDDTPTWNGTAEAGSTVELFDGLDSLGT